ncbi:hypothetical protein OnM2_030060 [Erysiphe neolycopersici]|uniref:Uncharacterized protein n=1 Tax=Erysiphe neolycopersici TaxID=212602 RepID=A0A420HZB3_9PEZI|nr:hypothetical protein OnM2_030060 [Erysiphe neolycopersici]
MVQTGLFEPITPPQSSETILTSDFLKDTHSQIDSGQNGLTLVHPSFSIFEKEEHLKNETPYTPPQSTLSTHSLIQDENLQVGLVQFINAHNRADVSYNAVVIDMRCENYHELIRLIYEATIPQLGVRWGIARIDILWELPVSMTTVESGNYRETSLRGMQGPALQNILRLMKGRGWRDIFVVRYIEG